MHTLITGATGHLGSAIIDTLLQYLPADQLHALVRKEEDKERFTSRGVHAHLGNYDDPASLRAAMEGVEKVLLISGGDQGDLMQQHRNVVNAAKGSGVKYLGYTGRSMRDPTTLANQLMVRHFQTETYLKESGMKYVLFRNALYMDVLPLFVGKQVFEKGIAQPAGNGRVAYALRSEMGEAIGRVLATGDCENRTYRFTGSAAYSFDDVAAALSELSGKQVTYTSVEKNAFTSMLKERGVPEPMVKKILDFDADIAQGQESEVSGDLAEQLGRKPTPLKEGLKQLFNL